MSSLVATEPNETDYKDHQMLHLSMFRGELTGILDPPWSAPYINSALLENACYTNRSSNFLDFSGRLCVVLYFDLDRDLYHLYPGFNMVIFVVSYNIFILKYMMFRTT